MPRIFCRDGADRHPHPFLRGNREDNVLEDEERGLHLQNLLYLSGKGLPIERSPRLCDTGTFIKHV